MSCHGVPMAGPAVAPAPRARTKRFPALRKRRRLTGLWVSLVCWGVIGSGRSIVPPASHARVAGFPGTGEEAIS